MLKLAVFLALGAVVLGQNSVTFGNSNRIPCGFSCSQRAGFSTVIDGQRSSVSCSDGTQSAARCSGCCEAVALSAGLPTSAASGFVSSNGRSCACCITGCVR
ncbi:unnamed protein product [Caenorhabditis auriculariae]|uniref:Uncharacterized protein n=1 Tax=Caenorhabditis auriculariae TaxID=2777116 RepID=A0A8S1GQ73_9PELO|nr:unnamed protein product [Caenorhabditis auriculariae]